MIRGEKTTYRGWQNVWRLRNGSVELLVTADVGPRIIHFGFENDENEFYEVPEQAGLTGGDEFRIYGGHRLWIAPETDRTTFPDNRAVDVQNAADCFVFTAPPEAFGIQKALQVQLHPDAASVRVAHAIRNAGATPTTVSLWAITVLRPGGRAVLPLPPSAPHGPGNLLPVTALALWPYTDLTAPCWQLGPKYIALEQATVANYAFGMQKLGMMNKAGWGAYLRNGHIFQKRTAWQDGKYVDTANFELFANDKFLELETLSPDQVLAARESCVHIEEWSLRRGEQLDPL